MQRVLRGSPFTLRTTFYNGTTPVDLDAPPSVVVKKADGTTLVSGAATGPVSNVYSYVVPAQTNLNQLTVTWTGAISAAPVTLTTYAEIVGAFLFDLADLRNYDSQIRTNTDRYPDSRLLDERLSVESEFEDICDRSFIPRYNREEYATVGENRIELRKPEAHAITMLEINGVDRLSWVASRYITYDIYDPYVLLLTGDALGVVPTDRVEIEYEYGMTQVPRKIRDVGLKRAKGNLLGYNSAVDERATTLSVPEFGTMTLATAGRAGYETGIPDVDAVLNRWHIGMASGGVF